MVSVEVRCKVGFKMPVFQPFDLIATFHKHHLRQCANNNLPANISSNHSNSNRRPKTFSQFTLSSSAFYNKKKSQKKLALDFFRASQRSSHLISAPSISNQSPTNHQSSFNYNLWGGGGDFFPWGRPFPLRERPFSTEG